MITETAIYKYMLYPVLGAISGYVIDGTMLMPLGGVIGLVFVVWKLAAIWQAKEDEIKEVTKEIKNLTEEQKIAGQKLHEMHQKLISLPCIDDDGASGCGMKKAIKR